MRGKRGGPAPVEPESDVERTDYVPVVDTDAPAYSDRPTERFGTAEADPDFADELLEGHGVIAWPPTPASRARRRASKVLLGVGGLLIIMLAVYSVDLMRSIGDVPRGVTVLGVDVGGMDRDDAEAKLRRVLGPRLTEPVPVRAGDMRARLDPARSGLALNWAATLDKAGRQPINPISRALSLFTTTEVDVVPAVDPDALHKAVTNLARTRLNHPPTEGSIDFEPVPGREGAVHAFAVEPRQGQRIVDIDEAVRIIKENWLGNRPVTLPVEITPVRATSAGVHATLEKVVKPMISAPVRVRGAGAEAILEPATIAEALHFSAEKGGTLRVRVDRSVLKAAVSPQLLVTEERARDARIVLAGPRPTVEPGNEGRAIDWAATFGSFAEVAKRGENRVLPVRYATVQPKVSTAELEKLGITEVVGKFSTDGLSGAIRQNVSTLANEVNGTVVRPGDTFRLNEYTGARTSATGYVRAPAREDGSGEEVVGGGVSQFTSTLYNAAYLAGLKDAGHTAHEYYFPRYPAARDATSLSAEGEPVAMGFTNDAPTGLLIQADVSGDTVTVTLWGTKRYRVETSTSDRGDVTKPSVEHRTEEGCQARDGRPGFTVSSTRVLYDVDSGDEVRKETTTVTYEPRPKVVCHEP